jgi:hypothetical protein
VKTGLWPQTYIEIKGLRQKYIPVKVITAIKSGELPDLLSWVQTPAPGDNYLGFSRGDQPDVPLLVVGSCGSPLFLNRRQPLNLDAIPDG